VWPESRCRCDRMGRGRKTWFGLRQRIEIVLSSKALTLLGDGDEGQNRGAKASQGRPARRGTLLHKRGTSAEDWGGGRRGRAARSLTGARGGFPPVHTFRTRQRRQASASRPKGRRTSARERGDSRPSKTTERWASPGAREAGGEVPTDPWAPHFRDPKEHDAE
jgi:hypothetical protein